MEALDELKIWVKTLTVGEKRHLNLLGKARSGAQGSQQLELMDWLNNSAAHEAPPSDAGFLPNLPTVIARLKDLILESLRLLHHDHNIDAALRTAIDHIALLREKQLFPAASRLLKRAKKRALESSRYLLALALLEQEHALLLVQQGGSITSQLAALRAEETEVLQCLHTLRELQQRHERLLSLVRHASLPRDHATAVEVYEITSGELLHTVGNEGRYLERALAVNILGVRLWVDRKPIEAVYLYASLLREWRDHPHWLVDQASLLFTICNYFQTACFYSKLGWDNAREYLQLVPDFKLLAPQLARDYQRMLYHNRLTPALNTANFDSVQALIPEIDQWLTQAQAYLTEAQILPFLHNFAIATFLMGEHQRSNRYLQRIFQLPNRKIRTDIREFALVLQAILQYEMGNFSLNEYLTRAGKRHFHKHNRALAFEYSVFKFLEQAMRGEPKTALAHDLRTLQHELDQLADQVPDAVPLLGLTEVRLWVQSKQTGQALAEVFSEVVRVNLETMG